MPTCFSCGKPFDTLSPTGLCRDCIVNPPKPRPFHASPVPISQNPPAAKPYNCYLKGVFCELFVYDDRVEIKRSNFTAAGTKTIPFSSMMSIQYKEAGSFYNGYIQFGILGGMEARNGIFYAIHDENSVVFLQQYNHEAKAIKDYIENIILKNQKSSSSVCSTSSTSAADELFKYKQLLDIGVITQSEFDSMKKRLLDF